MQFHITLNNTHLSLQNVVCSSEIHNGVIQMSPPSYPLPTCVFLPTQAQVKLLTYRLLYNVLLFVTSLE